MLVDHLNIVCVCMYACVCVCVCVCLCRQKGTVDAEIKSHLLRTHGSKIPTLKPGVDQYIAMHAALTARDFFPANFYSPGPFICNFFQNLS